MACSKGKVFKSGGKKPVIKGRPQPSSPRSGFTNYRYGKGGKLCK